MKYSQFRRYCAIAAGALLASTITIHPPTHSTSVHLTFNADASARSSGGRSGGGSFRSPSNSGSSSRSTGSSSRNTSPSYSRDRNYNRNYNNGPVVVPVPVGPGIYNDPYRQDAYRNNGSAVTTTSDDGWLVPFLFLTLLTFVLVGLIFYFVLRGLRGGGAGSGELDNDTVTISKIQVALLANARDIQTALTNLSLEVDTDTPDGLLLLLQESALALLRMPESWSHVLASSQTAKSRDDAEAIFNQISIAERSKFSVETLTNVGGRVNRRDRFKPDPDEAPASYIVVTLLVGTAHDKPLFSQIRTEQELKDTLEKLAAISADYLMVFELLWSPQDSSDSLTADELLTEYTDMLSL